MIRVSAKAVFVAVIVWLVCTPLVANAQKLDVGVDFLLGLPQEEFGDNIDDEGYGVDGHVGYFLGKSPIMIGADIGFLNYGTLKRQEFFSETIPDVLVDVRNTNNILMLHAFARIQPQHGPVRPYFEGLWGFKYLFTRTTIEDDFFDEPIASFTNLDDFAGSWGLGSGVDIRMWRPSRKSVRSGIYDVSLNLSARYLWGSEADYLTKGSIVFEPDGGITYFVSRSNTNMLLPRIGVRIRF